MADDKLVLEIQVNAAQASQQLNDFITTMGKMRGQGLAFDDVVDKLDKSATKVSTSFRDVSTSATGAQGALKQTNTNVTSLGTSAAITAGNLPRLRYALYDVSNAAGIFGAAVLGASTLVIKSAIDYQREFADVARTSGVAASQADALKQSFIDLSTSIPTSFADLAKIGTLGGQLGIATDQLATFSGSVAKFTATTGVSVDSAGTAFGRLNALLPDVQGNYTKLSDSILKVGVNSVATESEIINISTQIAGISNVAGLSSDEVIGLSGALASLGLPAERSRGLVTRLFTNIQTAIADGGPKLEQFGKVAGESGAAFAQGWKNSPSTELVKLLEGINATGPEAIQTIQSLGLTSVRDIPALAAASQNAELFVSSFSDALNSSGTTADQYGIITQTVAAKLQVFTNNFNALTNAIGSATTGPLAGLLDWASGALKAFTTIASNPVGQTVSLIAIAVTVLSGALALVTAGALRAAASFYAVQTASLAAGAGAGIATAGITAFKVALIGTGIGAAVVIIGSLAAALIGAGGAFDQVGDKATKAFGDISGFAEAVKADTATYESTGKAIQTYSASLDDTKSATLTAAQVTAKWIGGQQASKTATDETTKAIQNQTVAFGEQSVAALKGLFAQDKAVQRLANDPELRSAFEQIGGDFGKFATASLEGGTDKYIAGLKAKALALNPNMGKPAEQGGDPAAFKNYTDLFNILTEVGGASDDLVNKNKELANTNSLVGITAKDAAAGTDGIGTSVASLTDQYKTQIDSIFESVNAMAAQSSALQDVGKAFAESGADAAFSGQGIQQYINSVLASSGSSVDAANQLQSLVNAILAGGYAANASAPSLQYLQQVIATLGGSTTKNTANLSPFVTGINSVKTAATGRSGSGGAAKAVRTLTDYASDLKKVMSRAFDIRFGSQDAIDQVTAKWQDLNDQMRDYQTKVTQLTADQHLKEYFLSIANAYGDTLRAGVLQGDLSDIAGQLADAQAGVSTELQGNSKAAVKNRSTITGLVKGYDDYISSLAASGASQATLNAAVNQSRADFISQATALGYSTQQLQPYIAAFNDMTVAINNVPKNITVTANTNPALQALNELDAAARNLSGKSYSGPTITTSPSVAKSARAQNLVAQIAYLQSLIATAAGPSAPRMIDAYKVQIAAMASQLSSGSYKEGGYTGSGGKSAPAGVVHGKEFVFTAEATKNAGVGNLYGMMHAYEQGRGYRNGGYVAPVSVPAQNQPGVGTVQLSAYDRKLLADIKNNIGVTIAPGRLASSVNGSNANSSNRGAA